MKRLFCVSFLLAGFGLASGPAHEAPKIDVLRAADWQQHSLQGNAPASDEKLVRVLCSTQAYQREVTRAELAPGETYHFNGPLLRRMMHC